MTKTIALVGMGVYFALAGTVYAQAPAPSKNIFVDVNFGVQANSQDIAISQRPVIYGETAFIDSSQTVESSPFFDVMFGYRVWNDLSVGLGVTTTFNKTSTATVSASIPSPVFFDRRVVTNGEADELEHKERSAHILVMWTSPINDKIDGSLIAGPTYIKTFQGLVRTDVPAGSQTPTFTEEVQTATSWGFLIGGDITYLLNPRTGVGALIRYVAAKADLASVEDLKVGGFQIGGGIRLRF